MPNVPTIALPTGKTLDMQENINASKRTTRQTMPSTFFLVKFELYFFVSKIKPPYSSTCANKSSKSISMLLPR